MKKILFVLMILLLVGCSQEGDLTVVNRSGPDLEVEFDGNSYLLYDGESVTKSVNIGRKFIFGPDEKTVGIYGEGECKFPFETVVMVEDDRQTVVTVRGDAGFFDICNDTGRALEIYLAPCWDDSWGDPLEILPDGYCTTWKVEEGCWDMRVESIDLYFEDFGIEIYPCYVAAYDILPPIMNVKSKTGGLKQVAPRGDSKELRKEKVRTREK